MVSQKKQEMKEKLEADTIKLAKDHAEKEKALKKNGFKIKVNIDEDNLKRKVMSDLEITARKII